MMGFSPASVPEGFQRASGKPFGAPAGAAPLPRMEIDAPTAARVVGLAVLRVSRQLRCPKVSKGRAESPLVRPQAHTPCPRMGVTRRLRRESRACRPMGRSHFSFGGERKVCKRKPAARRLREKALYCPFLKEGVRNVARRIVGEITSALVRARAHSFPLSKRARLFPSAAYRRPRPRGRRGAYLNFAGWEIAVFLMYLCNAKCQRGFKSTLAFFSEP